MNRPLAALSRLESLIHPTKQTSRSFTSSGVSRSPASAGRIVHQSVAPSRLAQARTPYQQPVSKTLCTAGGLIAAFSSANGSTTRVRLEDVQLRQGIISAFKEDDYALHPSSKVEVVDLTGDSSRYAELLKETTFIVIGASGTMGGDFVNRLESCSEESSVIRAQRSSAQELLTDQQIEKIDKKRPLVIVNAVGASDTFREKYEVFKERLKAHSVAADLVINLSLHNPVEPENAIGVTPVKADIGASSVITGDRDWKNYSELEQSCLSVWGLDRPLAIHNMDSESGKINQAIMHLCLMGTICLQNLVTEDKSDYREKLEELKLSVSELIQSRSDTDSAVRLSGISCQFIEAFSDYISSQSERAICEELIEQTKGGLNIVAARGTITIEQAQKLKDVLSRHELLDEFRSSHGAWWNELKEAS